MSVPNQKIIQVQKAPCNKNNLYCTINLEALQQAMSELSGAGLALWLYLSKNQNGYSLELSPADATSWGIKKSSFYRAIDELTKLGYIRYLKGNVFAFCENPSPKMELIKSQNETQKNQVPKWDLVSPKMRPDSPKMGLSSPKMNIEILQILQIIHRPRRRRPVILQGKTIQPPLLLLPIEKKQKRHSIFKEDFLL